MYLLRRKWRFHILINLICVVGNVNIYNVNMNDEDKDDDDVTGDDEIDDSIHVSRASIKKIG